MGERRRKWKKREEVALRAGVAKYGFGKWKRIKKDPEFSLRISGRSNENLNKQWRSLIKERKRRPLLKSDSLTPNVKNPSPVDSDLANLESDVRDAASRYDCNALVFEAISTINDGKGAEFIEIFNFIKERYKVRKTFKRQLIYRLNTLVSRKTLIKLQERYKVRKTFKKQQLLYRLNRLVSPKKLIKSSRNSNPVCHGTKKVKVFTRHHKKKRRSKKKYTTKELLAEEALIAAASQRNNAAASQRKNAASRLRKNAAVRLRNNAAASQRKNAAARLRNNAAASLRNP